jgi:hypothetical protein
MKLSLIFFIILVFASWFHRVDAQNFKTTDSIESSLNGIWVNADTAGLKNGDISWREYSYPCTAFALKFDKHKNTLTAFVQYGEQKASAEYKDIRFKQNDSSVTIYSNQERILYFDLNISQISDPKFVSYKVLKGPNSKAVKFLKISPAYKVGNNSNFALAKIFQLFPLSFSFDHKLESLAMVDDSPAKIFLKVKGFKNYSSLQITNVKVDRQSKDAVFTLAFNSPSAGKWDFYKLKINRITNVSELQRQ